MSRAKITSPKEIRQLLAGAWMTREEVRRDLGLVSDEVERNTCRVCGETVRMQIRRGTGFCSGRCEDGEREEQEAKAEYAVEASARESS